MLRKIIILFIAALTVINTTEAQIVLQGQVVDATNESALVGVFISVKGIDLYAVTEPNGTYQLILPTPTQPKTIIVQLTSLGFVEINQTIELLPIDDGETLIRNFKMDVDPLTLKDVTVTANKVEEKLQDVPIAISVIDAKNLQVRSVATTEEAMEGIPNLIMGGFVPSRPSVSLRGLASIVSDGGIESSVGLYIDEVFQTTAASFNSTIMDIERIEVLRGPQGTLFGKNTIGGLLHVVTEKPKFGNFGAIEVNAGSFQYLQVRGKANVELIPNKLAWRTTGAYRQRDGWLIDKNVEVDKENGILFYGGRTALRFKPNEDLEIDLVGTYNRDDKADFRDDYQPSPFGDLLMLDPSETDPEDRRVFQNDERKFFREDYAINGNLKYKLGDKHTLTAISGYTNTDNTHDRDFDASSADAVFLSQSAQSKAYSQEIRISTPRENNKFFYMAGLYFLTDERINKDSIALKADMADIWKLTLNNPNLPLGNNYFESAIINSTIQTRSYAGFLSGSYELVERIRLNAGIRYTYEDRDLTFVQTPFSPFGLIGGLLAAPIGTPDAPLERTVNTSAFSGNIGMDFKTTDKILIYVNFSRGFKGAGYSVAFTPDIERGGFIFEPEFVNNYELGLKLKHNNRYLFNASAFVTDFQDKQELVIAGTSAFVSNAESIQGIGLEGEFVGIWNNFLKTDISFGLLDLKYLDFPFLNPFTNMPQNLSGNRARKAPNFTFKFAPEFHTFIGKDIKLLARFDYSYVGKSYNDIFNSEEVARQGTGILNARLTFSTKNERYAISIWGRNLTDELFYENGGRFVFGNQINPSPPRMLGMELRLNFY